MFDSLLQTTDAVYGTTSTVTMGTFIACLIASLVLGFGVSIVYMLTHKKEGYTQSYAITLIMLPPIVCVLLMLINFIGGIVTKRRVSMTLAESDAYLRDRSKPECTKYITEQVFRELDVFLDNYPIAPKQYISYQREAFFGKDNSDFRLTFDRKITDRRYDLGLDFESYGNQIIREDQRLMEVKVSDSMPEWLINKLSELQIYKTSFSKYGKAYMNHIKEEVAQNSRIYISGISMVNHSIFMNRSV